MLKTLKLVAGAISSAIHTPSNLHFRIADGRIKANNGHLAIEAPIESDLNCCPHAGQLIKAVSACEGVISMHVDAGRLVVKSGKFKTYVSLYDPDSWRDFLPSGNRFNLTQPLLPIFKKLLPVAAIESPRHWAKGIKFEGKFAVATNSICLLRHELSDTFPIVANIPWQTVTQLIAIGKEPVSIQSTAHAMSFFLGDGITLTTSLICDKWPNLESLFSQAEYYCGTVLSNEKLESLMTDLVKISKFTSLSCYFQNGHITSSLDPDATCVESEFAPESGKYDVSKILSLRGSINSIGFDCYPEPIPLRGENIAGLLMGMRS